VNPSSNLQKIENILGKPALTFIIGVGLQYLLFPGTFSDNIKILDKWKVPTWAGIGMTSAAGSFIGEIGKQYVMPTLLAKYPNYSRGISMSVSPVLSGVATSAI